MQTTTTTLRQAAALKVGGYTWAQCEYAIDDCHDTLKVGEYPYDSPYAQKLWAEIDACRDRVHSLFLTSMQ